MTHRPIQVRVDEKGVLWLAGELDMAEADTFLEMAAANVDAQRDVVLECSRSAAYCDRKCRAPSGR